MKKIVSFFISLIFIVSTFSGLSIISNAESIGNYEYTIDKNNNVVITSYTGEEQTIYIPGEINNVNVVSIADDAFSWNLNVKTIIFPDNITSIGASAFTYCSYLTTVGLPSNLKSISSYAFSYCVDITTLIIPRSVEFISSNAFTGSTNLVISCYENSYAHTYAVEQNIPFKLIAEPKKYTVTFIADGSTIATQTVNDGGTLTDIPPVPEKQNCTGVWDVTNFSNITSDMTITAVYTEIIQPYILGDVNGDNEVNVIDTLLVLQHITGKTILTGNSLKAANMSDQTGDNPLDNVDVNDVLLILQKITGKI